MNNIFQFILKVVILFLIIFNFRIPFVYNSAVLSVFISTFYYLFFKRTFPFTYFYLKHNTTILIGLFLSGVFCAFITIAHNQYDFTIIKILLLQLFMLCSLIYALPIMLDERESDAFELSLSIVCYTFALQGLIQLLGLLIPPFGEWLISIKSAELQEFLRNNPYNIYFRGYALAGNPLFELPGGYGLAFILFFRLLQFENLKYIPTLFKYLIFTLLSIGSIMSGRTAYIGFGIGLIMSILTLKNPMKVIPNLLKFISIIAVVVVAIFNLGFSSSLKNAVMHDIFPFAFEFYYNYEESGKFSTGSSDALEHHYYELSDEILMTGAGRYLEDGGYFGKTDAGYMRKLLYGGIPYLLCLIGYQMLYFIRPLSISNSSSIRNRNDFLLFLTMLVLLFVLEIKGDTIGTQNITEVLLLFITASYMIQYYKITEANGPNT